MQSAFRQPVNDRRASHRYPLSAEVRYLIVSRTPTCGACRTVNVSSGGALIQTADRLPNGAKVKLSIAWPARLNGRLALSLDIVGRIVRVNGLLVGVSFDHHEFRTRGLLSEPGQEASTRGASVVKA